MFSLSIARVHMQSNRTHLSIASLSIASVFLTMSASVAQQPATPIQSTPKLPACTSSMIVGTWYAAFGYGSPIYGTAQNNGFACPLNVAANGAITSGTCILGSAMTVSPVPSGAVAIDKSCHVVGSITFGYCNPGRSCINSWEMSVSLWRSADGSRLTGTQVLNCPKCKSIEDPAVTWVSPFEMILGQ
jgi:hypothetical protein